MGNKKLVDYDALYHYDERWKLKFQEMIISDDEMEDILLNELGVVPTLPTSWTESANGTLDLSLSNAYSYWPEGAGTKTVSITNGTTSGLSKFFLKLTDAGNFPMQWGSNIQWKNGSEPNWQAFNEDIIYFRSSDGGNTWTGQVVQTTPITPYWKLTVNAQHNDTTNLQYSVPANWGMFFYLPFPSNEFPNDAIINWGDGTIQTHEQFEYDTHVEISTEMGPEHTGVPKHTYSNEGIYHIIIQASTFEDIYTVADISGDSFVGDAYFAAGVTNIISIDSPLPKVKGSWSGGGSVITTEDNVLYSIFANYNSLNSIPNKLFYNNPNVTSLSGCLSFTSITSIPSGLFDKNTAVTSFGSCFDACYSLASIPSGLFDKNTAVTSFGRCFGRCSSLTSIPSGLFDKNTAVTIFHGCFSECSSLTSIPSGLFNKNTNVTDFSSCFWGCSSLTSVPSGLFNKNTAVTTFQSCFISCTSLGNFTLNIGSSLVTNASSFVTKKAGTTRTINVPSGSGTLTTFNNVASSLGLTIVGV